MLLAIFFISLLSDSATSTYDTTRILHQTFFTVDSLPPSQPPSPSPSPSVSPSPTPPSPKYPFSSFTPDQFPFFPAYPSPPTPPPAPSSFASFPANISSLTLPQNPKSKSSYKLFSIAVAAVVSAVVVVCFSILFYCRWRRRYVSPDRKTHRSENSSNGNNGTRKVRAGSSASSGFLYLGTIGNSRGIDDRPETRNNDGGAGNSSANDGMGLGPSKMDSPELQPLPPLARQTSMFQSRDSGERESSAIKGENLGRRNGGSSPTSGSSSTSGSTSVSISPPVSLSPRRSMPNKSPESTAVCGPYSSPPLIEKQPPFPSSFPSPSERERVSNASDQSKLSSLSSSASISPSKLPSDKHVSMPPELKPPSRSFMFQTSINVSPVDLPPPAEKVETFHETSKPKLKNLHWEKVRARSDCEMVWDHLRSSSFELNEEMIETLFVVNTPNPNPNPKESNPRLVLPHQNQESRVLDPRKAQNISILLKALNVTINEVCEALLEGHADALGSELLESLLKMAPTIEEECKLKEYNDDSSMKLAPAEKFLKAMVDIPFAFKRVAAMLYIANFESEIEYLRKSFETLKFACEELRNSRMFLKLLEAVLKTGNRMNVGTDRGDAQAFKLDTLLKLVDVKGVDGKTTLLHFVVQEIVRAEGVPFTGSNQTVNSNEDVMCRKLGLQVVSGLGSELTNVKKAAAMDSQLLSNEVSKLSRGIAAIAAVVRLDESHTAFSESMNKFMRMAEDEIVKIQAQEELTLFLVKEITEYFHGNLAKEEVHPCRMFTVVRDFLNVLDRVCKEVGSGIINERTRISSTHRFPVPVDPMLPSPLPGLH